MRYQAIKNLKTLPAAGFAATAISYGPARMGFGLFVPEFKSAFAMSTTTVGLVSSLGFAGFFIGLLVAQRLLNRMGPAAPVLSGLAAATIGLCLVALSPNVTLLAIGVFLAGSSAGFAWTPFNDAVHRNVQDMERAAVLSEISTGTSAGIALAGMLALAMVFADIDWRICWGIFAFGGVGVFILNWVALRNVGKASEAAPVEEWRHLLHMAAVPIFSIAFVFGITSAIFISFTAERFSASGGVSGIAAGSGPALVFLFYGLFGLSGLATGRVKEVIGLPWLLRALMTTAAVSLALVALLPGTWIGLISSAGLQGINVMMTSAVLAFWSERLFPTLPSFSFTTALLSTAAGSVIGPVFAGLASSSLGAEAMFIGAAILPLAAAAILRDHHVRERPAYGMDSGSDRLAPRNDWDHKWAA